MGKQYAHLSLAERANYQVVMGGEEMNGYFIPKEKANELGLLDNPIVASHLQKIIVAITEHDISEHQPNIQLDEHQINEMADWFYKNYYENLMDTLASF